MTRAKIKFLQKKMREIMTEAFHMGRVGYTPNLWYFYSDSWYKLETMPIVRPYQVIMGMMSKTCIGHVWPIFANVKIMVPGDTEGQLCVNYTSHSLDVSLTYHDWSAVPNAGGFVCTGSGCLDAQIRSMASLAEKLDKGHNPASWSNHEQKQSYLS